ncbi:Pex19-domain-containing protein [Pholiota conissans]|uniref:Pex19-domain-containing protein n=1 Tax=Pholiota conissans TaxID=109636 RepID=A0A9P6CWE0_9AGAR|nr:Pex19-domain-containing protein [Pholiota conissans]
MSASTTKPTLDKVNTDPEDDLDDLDDVLSQFNPGQTTSPTQVPASPLAPAAPPPTAAGTGTFGRPRTNTRVDGPPQSIPGSGSYLGLGTAEETDEDALSLEFTKELAKGMENLMREIAGEAGVPDAGSEEVTEEERARAFKAAWEAMLVEGMDGNLGEGGLDGLAQPSGAAKSKEGTTGTGGFQDKIKQAMDKMKESESKMQGAAGGSNTTPTPESLEALLQSLGDLGLGEGGEDETELAGLLETMMGQLMSKEVLYEPLKELADGFPGYLEKPPAPLSTEDRTRYESQLVCVKKIIAVFEKTTYSDSNPVDNKQIVDLMGEMQTYGTPPTEIMGSLPPGLEGPGGLASEDCTIA